MYSRKNVFMCITLSLVASCITACQQKDITNTPPPVIQPSHPREVGIPSLSEIEKYITKPVEEAVLLSVYESVTGSKPELLNNEAELSREIFESIKRTPMSQQSASDILKINSRELLAFLKNPIGGYRAFKVRTDAARKARDAFPCGGGNDDKADAVRHAYFNAIVAKIMRETYKKYDIDTVISIAREFGTAHEYDQQGKRPQMDLANNNAGYTVFRNNQNANELELLEIVSSLPFEYFGDAASIPLESVKTGIDGKPMVRLAYYVDQSKYDGEYAGSMTNPDANIVWNAKVYISECKGEIKGQYILKNNDQYAYRRITGKIDSGFIDLDIEYPYEWQISQGSVPCENMKAHLKDDLPVFSGPWSASNCLRGGYIQIKKD